MRKLTLKEQIIGTVIGLIGCLWSYGNFDKSDPGNRMVKYRLEEGKIYNYGGYSGEEFIFDDCPNFGENNSENWAKANEWIAQREIEESTWMAHRFYGRVGGVEVELGADYGRGMSHMQNAWIFVAFLGLLIYACPPIRWLLIGLLASSAYDAVRGSKRGW